MAELLSFIADLLFCFGFGLLIIVGFSVVGWVFHLVDDFFDSIDQKKNKSTDK